MVETHLLQFVMIHHGIFKILYSLVKILSLFEIFFNSLLLVGRPAPSFFSGARFLSQCEVSYMQETSYNNMYPSENLNDVVYVSL